MARTELVLLDLDGCLVDSTAAITGSIRRALTEVGVAPPPAEALGWCVGPPLLDSLGRLLREAEADPALATRCLDAFRDHYRTASLELTRVIEGVPAALAAMADAAVLAVVTSKPGPAAVPLIEHLGLAETFVAVHAPDADHQVEAKAVTLARALAALAPGGDPSTAVMVGDRSHDVVAGLACGTGTVGVTWGAGDRAELARAGAHAIVDRPEELVAAVLER